MGAPLYPPTVVAGRPVIPYRDLMKIYGLVLGALLVVGSVDVLIGFFIMPDSDPVLILVGSCFAFIFFLIGGGILYGILKRPQILPAPTPGAYSYYYAQHPGAYVQYYYYQQPGAGAATPGFGTPTPNPYQTHAPAGRYRPGDEEHDPTVDPSGALPAGPQYALMPGFQMPVAPQYQAAVGNPYAGAGPSVGHAATTFQDRLREKLDIPGVGFLLPTFIASVVLGTVFLYGFLITGNLFLGLLFFITALIGFSFPSLMWISYVYSKDIYEPEPARMVFIALTWGMLSAIPASIINTAGLAWLTPFIVAAVIAPLNEEFFKPLVLPYLKKEINSDLDGIIYGVTAAMGFAMVENFGYEIGALLSPDGGAAAWTLTTLVRGIASVPVHALGSGLIGWAYARWLNGRSGPVLLVAAYGTGVMFHGGWNGSISVLQAVAAEYAGLLALLIVVYPILVFMVLRFFVNQAVADDHADFMSGKFAGAAPAGAGGSAGGSAVAPSGGASSIAMRGTPQSGPGPPRPAVMTPAPSPSSLSRTVPSFSGTAGAAPAGRTDGQTPFVHPYMQRYAGYGVGAFPAPWSSAWTPPPSTAAASRPAAATSGSARSPAGIPEDQEWEVIEVAPTTPPGPSSTKKGDGKDPTSWNGGTGGGG